MLRLAEAKNKKKKSSSASARSGRSSNPQHVAQSSNVVHLPQNIIANRETKVDHRLSQVELPVTSTEWTVMSQSTLRSPADMKDPSRWWYPMWTPNAASPREHQVDRPQELNLDSIQHARTREHVVVSRLADRSRDLEKASYHEKHQPTIYRDLVSNDKNDRDEKIKMLMTRNAELKAPQSSSQGSGFMTPRRNKRTTKDLIDGVPSRSVCDEL